MLIDTFCRLQNSGQNDNFSGGSDSVSISLDPRVIVYLPQVVVIDHFFIQCSKPMLVHSVAESLCLSNRIFFHNPFILISDVRIVDMISTKQTIALHAIVIVAALTISAVPSPHAYAAAQGQKCLGIQTPSTGGHNTLPPPSTAGSSCEPNLFSNGVVHSQSIQMCNSGVADVKCSGSQTQFGASNVKP